MKNVKLLKIFWPKLFYSFSSCHYFNMWRTGIFFCYVAQKVEIYSLIHKPLYTHSRYHVLKTLMQYNEKASVPSKYCWKYLLKCFASVYHDIEVYINKNHDLSTAFDIFISEYNGISSPFAIYIATWHECEIDIHFTHTCFELF